MPCCAGHAEVWDFLSEASEAYGPASEVSFLKGLVRDANTSVRRAVGDMVDNMDSQRKKIISVVPNMGLPLPEAPWAARGGASAGGLDPLQRLGSISSATARQGSRVSPQHCFPTAVFQHSQVKSCGWHACKLFPLLQA